MAVDLTGWTVERASPCGRGPWLSDPASALEETLDSPEGMPPLDSWLEGARRVVVALGRGALLAPWPDLEPVVVQRVASRLGPGAKLSVIASGGAVHGASGMDLPGVPAVRIHDPREAARLEAAGRIGKSPASSVAQGLLGEVVRAVGGHVPSTARAGSAAGAARRRELALAREVLDADRIVTVSAVFPHPVLGYTGAGTVLVPGLADAATVAALDELGVNPVCGAGRVEGNPARDLVNEAVALLGDRIMSIDVVGLDASRVAGFSAGRPFAVARVTASIASETFFVKVRPAASVIASAPVDRVESLVELGALVVTAARSSGTLLLAGRCVGGMGDRARVKRLNESVLLPRLGSGRVLLLTGVAPAEIMRCGLRPVRSAQTALEVMRERAKGEATMTVVPDCSVVMPVL